MIVLGLSSILLSSGCSVMSGLSAGQHAPDFTLTNRTGQQVTLSQYQEDQAVLLVFFAVGCPPCREEAPCLTDIQKQFGDKGLRVIGVNAWDEPISKINAFVDDKQLFHMVLLKGKETFKTQYKGKYIPNSYLIDKDGKIVWSHVGWDKEAHTELIEEIKELLDIET